MVSVRPATWLEGRTCEHKPPQDAFCHALQSPETAAVFSPSLGVCLLLLIWGIAYSSPDLLLAAVVCTLKTGMGRRKHVRLFLAHLQIICTRALRCGACGCVRVCVREERRREREGEGKGEGERERERERGRGREKEGERERESEREGGREGKREIER